MTVLRALPNNTILERWIFLGGGQSNMDGRGFLYKLPPRGFELQNRVKQFKNDWKWYPGSDPLDDQMDNIFKDHPSNLGVGPLISFGSEMAKSHKNVEIGISQGALGSTSLASWAPNSSTSTLYGLTVYKAKRALEEGGQIKGILWHQGESDAENSETIANSWSTNFWNIIQSLRSDLNLPNLPVVYAVINNFNDPIAFPYWSNVKNSQLNFDLTGKNMARVSTDDLQVRTDSFAQGIHLDTEGQIILGQRFALAMNTLLGN